MLKASVKTSINEPFPDTIEATQHQHGRNGMDILILGGTNFLGPHLVAAALVHGHGLTLFNRGRRDLFPIMENIRGDRNSDLALLQGRHWDAVIDTSGYLPRSVRLSTEALAHAVERYIFISTISVYAGLQQARHGRERAPGDAHRYKRRGSNR
jgi:nucleoside-diphosphate-sugar epimerase